MMGRGVRERDGALVVMPGFRILPIGDIGVRCGEMVEFAAALVGVTTPLVTEEMQREFVEMANALRADLPDIPAGCRIVVEGEASGSPLPRVTGGIPEIVVTPAPTPGKTEEGA